MDLIDVIFNKDLLSCFAEFPIICMHEEEQDDELLQPGVFATLKKEDTILCTYKIFLTKKDYFLYNDSLNWHSWIVLGCGSHVHFISKANGEIKTHSLGDTSWAYFMAFHTSKQHVSELSENMLLVDSGNGLTLFNEKARLVWQVSELAVDGVVTHKIKNNIIYGDAEQDPPGNWVNFEVSLKDGSIIKMPKY